MVGNALGTLSGGGGANSSSSTNSTQVSSSDTATHNLVDVFLDQSW